jgi:molybdopterin converting factor small subunit
VVSGSGICRTGKIILNYNTMGRKKKKKLQQAEAITAAAEIKQAPVEAKQEIPAQPEPAVVPPSTGPVSEPAPDTVSTQPVDGPKETYEEPPTVTPSVAAEVEAENATAQTPEIQPEAPATEETTDVSQEAATYLAELKERALHIEGELNSMDTPEANVEALETELAGIKSQIAELDPESEIDM